MDGPVGASPRVLLAWRGREATVHDLADGRQRARFEHPDAVADGLVLGGGAVVTRDAGGGVWLWGDEAPPSDPLRSHLYLLRQALDRPFPTPMLVTVHGVGFKLDGNA